MQAKTLGRRTGDSRRAVTVGGFGRIWGLCATIALVGLACRGSAAPVSVVPLPLAASGPWEAESVHPIRWTVPRDLGPLDPTVTIVVTHDRGESWWPLAEVPLADEYYRWVLPVGYAEARIGVRFHTTGAAGSITDLRLAESPDVTIWPSNKRSYIWERVLEDAPFGPRDGAGGLVHDGKMWLLGGWNPERFPAQCANDVWSSTDGATWTLEKPNTFLDPAKFDNKLDWEGRHFGGYQVLGGKMWIVGGDPNQGYYQTDVWSSSDGRRWTRTDKHTVTPRINETTGEPYPASEWRPVEESQFGLRTAHIAAAFDGKLYVMGGQRISIFVDPVWPGRPAAAFNDVWTSTDGASFDKLATSSPMWAPRGYVSEAVEHVGRLWVVGGGLHDDAPAGRAKREYYNDVWSTKNGLDWEQTPDEAPFSPRIWHNVKSFDGRLWVINGYDGAEPTKGRKGDNLSDVWYTADGRNWYAASPPESFVARHAGTAWVYGDALYVGSGNAIYRKWHADVWRMKRSK